MSPLDKPKKAQYIFWGILNKICNLNLTQIERHFTKLLAGALQKGQGHKHQRNTKDLLQIEEDYRDMMT